MPIQTEIILKDGNFVRRTVTEQYLGAQDTLLQQMVEQQSLMLPNFMPFGEGSLHLMVSKSQIIIATELKKLPFKTWWKLASGTDLAVTWQNNGRGCIQIDDPWTFPAHLGKLIFAIKFDTATGRPEPVNGLLYVYRNRELYHLPYPNIYEDGRVCMGDEWDRRRSTGMDLISDFVHGHTSFHSTIASNHLTSERTIRVFKRNLDGWVTVPDDVFLNNLQLTSPAFMQGFAL